MDTIGIGLRGAQEFYFYPGPVDGGSLAQGREDAASVGMEGWKKGSEDVVIRFGERGRARRRAGIVTRGSSSTELVAIGKAIHSSCTNSPLYPL